MNPITVQRLLARSFARYADHTCIAWEGGCSSYAETARRITALAHALQQRTPAEGHIGILLPNSREFLELILACALGARVRVPLGDREPQSAIAQKLEKADCRLLFTTESWYERLREEMGQALPPVVLVGDCGAAATRYEDLAAASGANTQLVHATASERYRLSFTGGTTGTAKAVVETHRQELALLRNLLLEVIAPAPDRVYVAATPLSHASGAFVMPTVLRGGQLSWTSGFQPDRLVDSRWLGEDVRLQTFVVPTALDDLAASASGRDHALETVIYGGAVCPQPVLERAVEAIGPRLIQVYGQAEAAMTICVLGRDEHTDPAGISGCSGYPFLYVDLALEDGDGNRLTGQEDVGEVVVYSDHVMAGYWQDEDATAERFTATGGLRTQDLGRWDEHGRLWLVGRSREMFISGGYNIFPGEIERRLGAVAGVSEITAFGVPHPRWGEATVLAIVPAAGGDVQVERLRAEIDAASRERLASYEHPKDVVVVDELPLTSVGKVSRADLTKRFEKLFDQVQT